MRASSVRLRARFISSVRCSKEHDNATATRVTRHLSWYANPRYHTKYRITTQLSTSFTLRKNAKRAAEAMIREGIAPAVDYGVKLSDDGRFGIVWKIATSAPTTDEVETEIAEASADQPAAALPTEAASQPAPAATESATTDAAPQPAPAAEAASRPAPVATEAAPALS